MNNLIRKRDIDYISAPIAPVLKGEKVHYEYVAFRKQIEDISSVPAIPISVIDQIKAEIKELIDWHDCPMELDNGNDAWYCEACNMAISIIDKHIKEYTE